MHRLWFWVRWSLRDLRRRWVQVAVVALVIAIGTGAYAALSGVAEWRRVSYDASYEALAAHDVRVILPDGSFVDGGDLVAALGRMEHPGWVARAEERLVVPTQVDASTGGRAILVPGRIVGMTADGGVDEVYLTAGNGLTHGAVLEGHFADYHSLPARGTIELAGGVPVEYAGTGFTPESFLVTTGEGDFFTASSFAVVFMPLAQAQEVSGRDGLVNDLVVSLAPGVGREEAAADIGRALEAAMPDTGSEVETLEDDPAHTQLYGDMETDAATYDGISFLILAAATFAAFNLTSRIVEAQRREIGIGMALGARPRTIALRPLLVGAEIAALGVAFGVGIGILVAASVRGALSDLIPLPVWRTPFRVGPFAAAAVIGLALPVLAAAWPVRRAVRVNPVDAIRTGHLAAKGGGLAPLVKRVHVPGRSLAQIPVRNVLRAPRRTALTALGIGAAIVTMVAVLGAVDSFNEIVDRGSAEQVDRGAANRLLVTLSDFQPVDSDVVRAVEGAPSVGVAEPTLVLGATVSNGGERVDVRLQAMDLGSEVWHPTLLSSADAGGLPGIVLARKGAEDLGVEPGDTVTVRHPLRTGEGSFDLVDTRMRVIALHPSPMRFLAYADASVAQEFGLAGLTNELQVVPADGSSVDDVLRAMFELPGVALVERPNAALDLTGDLLDQYAVVFQAMAAFALFLALLIAFNSASISADERRREHATMAAYGVRIRTMLRMAMVEGSLIGVLGTLVGLGLGVLALNALMSASADTIPELEMLVTVSPLTVVTTIVLGVVVVGLAPLFTARKLRRMDLPSTLRVME